MKVQTKSGHEYNLTPSKMVGSGGEAEVFKIDNSQVAKIFKNDKHQDFTGNANLQSAVKSKLHNYEDKLSKFPHGLSSSVIAPKELLYTTQMKFCGFTMPLIDGAEVLMKMSERRYKEQLNLNVIYVSSLFENVHSIVKNLHQHSIVIGDFNDLNVMFKLDKSCYFIDVDSYQYANYQTLVYTEKFVDPMKCNDKLQLQQPHDENSDWYAFSVMVLEALLCTGPYGGIHKPKTGKKMTLTERIKNRVSIFHPEVQYPKPAYPIDILPHDLRTFLNEMILLDKRSEFPISLISQSHWILCKNCNGIHGNFKCPYCQTLAQITVKVQHNIKIRLVFETPHNIIFANHQNKIRYIVHKDNSVEREDGSKFKIDSLHDFRFRIMGDFTILAKGSKVVIVKDNKVAKLNCQQYGNLPLIDANSRFLYFIEGDILYRIDNMGNFRIGDVIGNSTLFWVGEKFGFGFYRVGELMRSFIFDAEASGINDSYKIQLTGNLIDATCVFTDELCWFFSITQNQAKRITTVHVINRKGEILEKHEDPSWLPRIRGNCAHRNQLFVADDDGISRYEIGGAEKSFVGTVNLCDIDSSLFYADGGIYVVDDHKITHLQA